MTTTNESSTATAIFRLTHDDGCWLQAELPSDMDSRERLALAQEEFGTTIVACDPLPANHPASIRHAERAARAPADGGAAFPVNTQRFEDGSINVYPESGMTLRAYAAIKLRVPDSGIDWLDDMIRTSMQDEFAAKAMHAFLGMYPEFDHVAEEVSADAYQMADAMLKARG